MTDTHTIIAQKDQLINNQDTYIRELEEKVKELQSTTTDTTDKKTLMQLVASNQAFSKKLQQDIQQMKIDHQKEIETIRAHSQ